MHMYVYVCISLLTDSNLQWILGYSLAQVIAKQFRYSGFVIRMLVLLLKYLSDVTFHNQKVHRWTTIVNTIIVGTAFYMVLISFGTKTGSEYRPIRSESMYSTFDTSLLF
jgi:hypothetical protein